MPKYIRTFRKFGKFLKIKFFKFLFYYTYKFHSSYFVNLGLLYYFLYICVYLYTIVRYIPTHSRGVETVLAFAKGPCIPSLRLLRSTVPRLCGLRCGEWLYGSIANGFVDGCPICAGASAPPRRSPGVIFCYIKIK